MLGYLDATQVSITKIGSVSSNMRSAIIFQSMRSSFTHQNAYSIRSDRRLVLIFMVCILISLTGWLRILDTLSSYNYLQEIGLEPQPVYLILSGILIGLLFFASILFLLLHKKWALTYMRWSCAVYLILILIENKFLSSAAGSQGNTASVAVPTLLGISLLFLSWPSRPKGSHYA